jgi:hypothetical protein
MITITGQIQDATGAALHATIDFASKSTPLAGGGVVTTNTDARILSNPSDGTFSVMLAPGNYQVTIAANGQSTSFNIAVPAGDSSVTIDTLVTTPLTYPFVTPNVIWNGRWAGNITFLPMGAPSVPTFTVVADAASHLSTLNSGDSMVYWVSYVTATGETFVSDQGSFSNTVQPMGLNSVRVNLAVDPPGVIAKRIWRTTANMAGGAYEMLSFPANIQLLATVAPGAAYYQDWESNADLIARNDGVIPPLYNTTAGQLLSNNGTACAFITDAGLFFPGANCRIKPDFGLQVYNFTTKLWYTLLVTGNPAQLSLDAGNSNQ